MRANVYLLSLALVLGAATAQADQAYNLNVQIRTGVTATLRADVLTNPNHPTGGKTLLIQHGLAHAGNAARPLAQAIFNTPSVSSKVSKVVLLNLPGRGGSSLSSGLPFGNLTLEDLGTCMVAAIEELAIQGVQVQAVLGHSMGGSVIQEAQKQLVANGTNFNSSFGIQNLILLAPGIPREVSWFIADSQLGLVLAVANLRLDLLPFQPMFGQGTYIDVPTVEWRTIFFLGDNLYLATGTPTVLQVDQNGYRSLESYVASAQLLGALPYERPSMPAGILSTANGVTTRVVAHEHDFNVRPYEEQANYRYLTGDNTDSGFTVVYGVDTVHDMLLSNPQGLLDAGLLQDL